MINNNMTCLLMIRFDVGPCHALRLAHVTQIYKLLELVQAYSKVLKRRMTNNQATFELCLAPAVCK